MPSSANGFHDLPVYNNIVNVHCIYDSQNSLKNAVAVFCFYLYNKLLSNVFS